MTKYPKFKPRTLITWLLFAGTMLVLYFIRREWFDLQFLRGLASDHAVVVVTIYFTILSLRGLTFIPSTPLIIAGTFIFTPAQAYFLNLVGILTSSTIVYYFAHFLGLGTALEARHPGKTVQIRAALRRKELPIIVAWSFFPLVPTDLIIYVASSMRIPAWKCLLGVLLGEAVLIAFYVFSINFAFLTG
jgi:uncharacterized membrane protein YdjX (TVP38/TMEM64 family)